MLRSRRSSPSPARPFAGRGSASTRRPTENRPPDGARTDASAGHCPERGVPPSVPHFCALPAAIALCNRLLKVLLDPRALRLAPDYSCMPQSGLLECLARLWLSWPASLAPNALAFKQFITQ